MGLDYQVKSWIIKGVFYIQVEVWFLQSEIGALLVVGVRKDFILTCSAAIKMIYSCSAKPPVTL